MPPQFGNRFRQIIVSLLSIALLQLLLVTPRHTYAQGPTVNRDIGIEMLREIKRDVKENYYDRTFRGINLDEHFKAAEQKIKASLSTAQIFGILGQVLIDFNDSHTSFIPPTLVSSVDYGWRMQMFGNKAYIVAVKPNSDAAAKGLKVGDEVHSLDGFQPTRENLWELEYSYYVLMPALRMTVGLREPDGKIRSVEMTSKIREHKEIRIKPPKRYAPLYFEASKDTIICKLAEFDLTDKEVDETMKKCGAYQKLILDLRGNPGGYRKTIQRLLSYFFDHEVKIAEAKGRDKTQAIVAKPRGDRVFKGRLIVLVDSESTSASEVFARVIQLEKRGVVIGDRTTGKVMLSITFGYPLGYRGSRAAPRQPSGFYGLNITISDVIMSDGKSLERVGVTPDEILFPTARHLATKQDPVMTRAAALFDVELDPQKAGTLFPSNDETEKDNKKKAESEN